jgi:ABC-type Fe3+/spermidine/putrescine transport system ATPase subunit
MISVSKLVKRFEGKSGQTAVNGIDFEVPHGNLFTLLGPSGCGKTTTLRMLAGLERTSEGRITIGGQVVFDSESGIWVPANKRPIGMVFQSYAIWPHMSVVQNVEFPLTVGPGRPSAAEARSRALAMLDLVWARLPSVRPRRFRAASSSALRSRGRWCVNRTCCCSTNRSAISMPSCANACAARSGPSSKSSESPPST